ncbi:hypothetical protein P12x_003339 [Tundrisphaera lichenicola]
MRSSLEVDDIAWGDRPNVKAPTRLIFDGQDQYALELNRQAQTMFSMPE